MFFIQLLTQRRFFVVLLPLSFLAVACTPTLNWREVRLQAAMGSSLRAQLPCKPDTATRPQQLADVQVELTMMGCQAQDTMFTLSRIPMTNPITTLKVQEALQAAAFRNLGLKLSPTTPATVLGASTWPPAVRVTLVSPTGQAQMWWFAKQTASGMTLYQAAIYGKQPSQEASAIFFESLQVQ